MRRSVQRPPVAEEAEKLEDKLGTGSPANADRATQVNPERVVRHRTNDNGCEGKGQL